MHRPRIVAVDYGTKRVGIAIADPLRLFAQPYGTFEVSQSVEVLQRLHAEEGIAVIVLGWPLTEDGTEGVTTQRVQEYLNRLRKALPTTRFVKWDERFTSELARKHIYASGGSRKRRAEKGRIDAAAAGIILQEYLESGGAEEGDTA